MRININRLSKLAGLPTTSKNSRRRSLYEGKGHDKETDEGMYEKEDHDEGMYEEDQDEGMYEDMYEDMHEEDDGHGESSEGMYEEDQDEGMYETMEDMEEMIEVDEAMLVQELRRAKKIMQENKKRRQLSESRRRTRKQRMLEAQLREMIDQEVQNVFDDMQLSGQWVYGKNKPTRSRKGYTHQGSFMPGIGFRR